MYCSYELLDDNIFNNWAPNRLSMLGSGLSEEILFRERAYIIDLEGNYLSFFIPMLKTYIQQDTVHSIYNIYIEPRSFKQRYHSYPHDIKDPLGVLMPAIHHQELGLKGFTEEVKEI